MSNLKSVPKTVNDTVMRQIILWCRGENFHFNNKENKLQKEFNTDCICVPDMSCCMKLEKETDSEVKQRYLQAVLDLDQDLINEILFSFVEKAFPHVDFLKFDEEIGDEDYPNLVQ